MAKKVDSAELADRQKVWQAAGATIYDPAAETGLEIRIEADAVPKDGVPFDTTETTGERVDCALCGRSRNHNKGFLVTFVDGRRALIGKECGETRLFEKGAWAEMVASSERRKRRVLFEARSAPALAAINKLLPLLQLGGAALALIDDFVVQLRQQVPVLVKCIEASRRAGGIVQRTEEVRVVSIDLNGNQKVQWVPKAITLARFPSLTPFDPGGFRMRLQRLQRALKELQQRLEGDPLSLQDQASVASRLRQLERDARELREGAVNAKRLLEPSFWQWIDEWARHERGVVGRFEVSSSSISHSTGGRVLGAVAIPGGRSVDVSVFDDVMAAWPRL